MRPLLLICITIFICTQAYSNDLIEINKADGTEDYSDEFELNSQIKALKGKKDYNEALLDDYKFLIRKINSIKNRTGFFSIEPAKFFELGNYVDDSILYLRKFENYLYDLEDLLFTSSLMNKESTFKTEEVGNRNDDFSDIVIGRYASYLSEHFKLTLVGDAYSIDLSPFLLKYNSPSDYQELADLVKDFDNKVLSNICQEQAAAEIDVIGKLQKEIQNKNEEIDSNIAKLIKKLNKKKRDISKIAIMWGLPLFCLTIVFLFLGSSIIRLFNKTGSYIKEDRNILLEISTVLLLTLSILILGLSGKVSSEVLGTLLGGISAYVLNKSRKSDNKPHGNNENGNPEVVNNLQSNNT